MPPFTVQYCCIYREYWYEDETHQDWASAVQRATALAQTYGRRVRVVDAYGQIIWAG